MHCLCVNLLRRRLQLAHPSRSIATPPSLGISCLAASRASSFQRPFSDQTPLLVAAVLVQLEPAVDRVNNVTVQWCMCHETSSFSQLSSLEFTHGATREFLPLSFSTSRGVTPGDLQLQSWSITEPATMRCVLFVELLLRLIKKRVYKSSFSFDCAG